MLISIQDITVMVGQQSMFEHTSWSLEKNQNWGILGLTGSGKSTLARAVCKKVRFTEGQVLYYFDGQERHYLQTNEILTLSSETHQNFLKSYADYHQARWQSFEGDDAPTVDALIFPEPKRESGASAQEGPKAASANKDFLVKLFQLEPLLDRKVLYLSHGETRKVLIAWMLHQAPKLLILDDPYNGLDQESREVLAHGIQDLIAAGETPLLFVSSRLEDLPMGIDHLLLVDKGQVVDRGRREDVLAREEFRRVFENRDVTGTAETTEHFDRMVEQYATALKGNEAGCEDDELVRMEKVCVSYGEVAILKDVDWTIRKGERWVLLGHNGAGKSTLLSLILADNPQAYANRIWLFGRERGSGESIWEIKHKIGWVSPELAVYYRKPNTCGEVVCSGFFDSVGLYQHCTAEQMEVAWGWMEAFGLKPLANEAFQSLSAGQRRLVLLARALVKNPPLLVLDEPCQSLDDTYRDQFNHLIDRLCQRTRVSLIYVTHYKDEIPASITHQLRLDHGRVVG